MFRAGSGAVEITPQVGAALGGQFNDRSAERIHDPLFARAFVVEDGTTAAAIVACDLQGVKRPTVEAARERVAARTGLPAGNVLICATHTHTGPLTVDTLARYADEAYLALLPDRIAGAVERAMERLGPAEVGSAVGREESTGHNRRFVRADGSVVTNPPKGAPGCVGPEGPVDPDVGVIFARDAERRLLGAVVNYACHPTVAGQENAISADYPGYVTRALRAVKGEQAEVVFVNGACGNVGPTDPYDLAHVERGFAWAERAGNVIAAEALQALEKADGATEGRIVVVSREIPLAIREVPPERLAWAHETMQRSDLGPRARERVYAFEALAVAQARAESPTVPAEIQVIVVGETAVVGIPGEVFVEIGLEIKRRSPFRTTFIAELANGALGYMPTRRAFAGGGYETELARSSRLTPDAAEQIADAAASLLEEAAVLARGARG